jgi:16S rRNA (uracil1498-N3)-methyltransferase
VSIRLHVSVALVEGARLALPESAARHAQVRRVQPGDTLLLFDGRGGEHTAQVLEMGRREVVVQVGPAQPALAELAVPVTLAVGMPANERMDFLVEKATELGVAQIQPLQCARSVLRLDPERAQRRCAHWQAVAVAAAEQSGRAVVPVLTPVTDLAQWCQALPPSPLQQRVLLSLSAAAEPAARVLGSVQGRAPVETGPAEPAALDAAGRTVIVLSGPEGGLTAQEEAAARAAGFVPVSLGPRVLRADTAPLALLAWLALSAAPSPPPARSA